MPSEVQDSFPDRLLFALSFLTRLPVPSRVHERGIPHRLGAFPLFFTGLLLGGILSLFAWICDHPPFLSSPLSPFLRAFFLLAAWTVLTGGLHLDGVADSMEAAMAPVSLEEKRRIRKDPRKGVFAIIALNLFLLGKWTGLLLLSRGNPALLLAPLLSRSLLPLLFEGLSRKNGAPPEGLGALLLEGGRTERWLVFALAGTVAALIGGIKGGVASFFLLFSLLALGRFFMRRLDGLSGDLAGFLIESGEILLLLFFSVTA